MARKEVGFVVTDDYKTWIEEVKNKIRNSQIKASVRINYEMLDLYWNLGIAICEKQKQAKWGDAFLKVMSNDLQKAFPGVSGFSVENLKHIRYWYNFYTNNEKWLQGVTQIESMVKSIPWGHNQRIMYKCKDIDEALFYIQKTMDNNWSRNVLVHQIESDLYARQGKAINNFQVKLPEPQSDLAEQTLKDPYNFDFLALREEYNERELEDALVEQIDQLNGQEQNAQQQYERELADYYNQLEQKGNAYNTAYTQDYGRYQDYLGQLDSLYGYYAAQEQQEAARRQQGFNNVMTVLGLLGDAAQLAITGTTGLGSMAGSLLNTGYNIYAGNRAYEAERADTAWKQKMQEQLRQDELAQQQYKNEQAQQEYQDKLRQRQVSNALAAERLDLSKSQWAAKQEKASRTAEKASADAAAKRGSLTGDTGLKVGKSGVSSGGTVPYSAARMRSQGRSDTAIRTQLLKEGYSSSEVRKIMQQLNS